MLDSDYNDNGECVAIISHGVTSNHHRPYLNILNDALSVKGISTLSFTFSGNGQSEGNFSDSTISKEVNDLSSILDFIGNRPSIYIGHSMGAAVGLKLASKDQRLKGLVSLAGMINVKEFFDKQFGKLSIGDLMMDRQGCPLSKQMLEDAREIGTLTHLGHKINIPLLFVHGDKDELVPIQDSIDMAEASSGETHLVSLPGCDHKFEGYYEMLVEAVVPWVIENLLVKYSK